MSMQTRAKARVIQSSPQAPSTSRASGILRHRPALRPEESHHPDWDPQTAALLTRFLVSQGIPLETSREPSFLDLVKHLNKECVLPPVNVMSKFLEKSTTNQKPLVNYQKTVGPLTVTLDTETQGDQCFLVFSIHYFEDLYERKNIVYLRKLHLGELTLEALLFAIRRAVNQYNYQTVKFSNIVIPNEQLYTEIVNSPVVKRSFVCFFNYMTLFVKEILEIPELKEGLEELREFVKFIRRDTDTYGKFRRMQLSKKAELDAPKLDKADSWESTAIFLTRCLVLHDTFTEYCDSFSLPPYISNKTFTHLVFFQLILQQCLKHCRNLSQPGNSISQVLPAVKQLRAFIEFNDMGLHFQRIVLEKLDTAFKAIGDRQFYQLAAFLDPRYAWQEFGKTVELEKKIIGDFLRANPSLYHRDISYMTTVKRLATIQEELQAYRQVSYVKRAEKTECPFSWWAQRKGEFEFLAIIAREYLATPATSISAREFFGPSGKFHYLCETYSYSQLENCLLAAGAQQKYRGRGWTEEIVDWKMEQKLGMIERRVQMLVNFESYASGAAQEAEKVKAMVTRTNAKQMERMRRKEAMEMKKREKETKQREFVEFCKENGMWLIPGSREGPSDPEASGPILSEFGASGAPDTYYMEEEKPQKLLENFGGISENHEASEAIWSDSKDFGAISGVSGTIESDFGAHGAHGAISSDSGVYGAVWNDSGASGASGTLNTYYMEEEKPMDFGAISNDSGAHGAILDGFGTPEATFSNSKDSGAHGAVWNDSGVSGALSNDTGARGAFLGDSGVSGAYGASGPVMKDPGALRTISSGFGAFGAVWKDSGVSGATLSDSGVSGAISSDSGATETIESGSGVPGRKSIYFGAHGAVWNDSVASEAIPSNFGAHGSSGASGPVVEDPGAATRISTDFGAHEAVFSDSGAYGASGTYYIDDQKPTQLLENFEAISDDFRDSGAILSDSGDPRASGAISSDSTVLGAVWNDSGASGVHGVSRTIPNNSGNSGEILDDSGAHGTSLSDCGDSREVLGDSRTAGTISRDSGASGAVWEDSGAPEASDTYYIDEQKPPYLLESHGAPYGVLVDIEEPIKLEQVEEETSESQGSNPPELEPQETIRPRPQGFPRLLTSSESSTTSKEGSSQEASTSSESSGAALKMSRIIQPPRVVRVLPKPPPPHRRPFLPSRIPLPPPISIRAPMPVRNSKFQFKKSTMEPVVVEPKAEEMVANSQPSKPTTAKSASSSNRRCLICNHVTTRHDVFKNVIRYNEKLLLMLGCVYRGEFDLGEARDFLDRTSKTYVCHLHYAETLDEIFPMIHPKPPTKDERRGEMGSLSDMMETVHALTVNVTEEQVRNMWYEFAKRNSHLMSDKVKLTEPPISPKTLRTLKLPSRNHHCHVCRRLTRAETVKNVTIDSEKLLLMLGCVYRGVLDLGEARNFLDRTSKSFVCHVHFEETLDEIYTMLRLSSPDEIQCCSTDLLHNTLITITQLRSHITGQQLRKILYDFACRHQHLREKTMNLIAYDPLPEYHAAELNDDDEIMPKNQRQPRKQVLESDEQDGGGTIKVIAREEFKLPEAKPSDNEQCDNPGVCCFCSRQGSRQGMHKIPRSGSDRLARWIEKLGPEFERRLRRGDDEENLICRSHFPEEAFSSRGRLLKGMIPEAEPETYEVTYKIQGDQFRKVDERRTGVSQWYRGPCGPYKKRAEASEASEDTPEASEASEVKEEVYEGPRAPKRHLEDPLMIASKSGRLEERESPWAQLEQEHSYARPWDLGGP